MKQYQVGTDEDWKVDVDVQALQDSVRELEKLEASREEWTWVRLKFIGALLLTAVVLDVVSKLFA